VTDQNPEGKYQALEKYGRDLTELARRGKIDPVIGTRQRNSSPVMQVLLRRTKNNRSSFGDPGVANGDRRRSCAANYRRRRAGILKNKCISRWTLARWSPARSFRGEFEDRLKRS